MDDAYGCVAYVIVSPRHRARIHRFPSTEMRFSFPVATVRTYAAVTHAGGLSPSLHVRW
jgi:hypothetical protein